jgi:hypothetical protein
MSLMSSDMQMRRKLRAWAVLALLLGSTSCANMSTVQNEPVESGDSSSFDARYEDVMQAARAAIEAYHLRITEVTDESDRGVILFIRPASMWQLGGVGRLVVDKSAAPPTVAHINYDMRTLYSYGSGQERWASALFAKMAATLPMQPQLKP